MDTLTKAARLALMSRIRSRDTEPETAVRRAAHALGYKFRLHRRGLPGTPDLVFPGRMKAIQVNGCFWHRHGCAGGPRTPKSNEAFWRAKLARNAERDAASHRALRALGWRVLVVWECETRDAAGLSAALRRFLK